MVRYSFKRSIKQIIFLLTIIVIYRNFSFYTKQFNFHQLKLKKQSSIIFIHSLSQSKIIFRLIRFLNELRLNYIQYKTIDENFYYNFNNLIPSIIILDYVPNDKFFNFINQYHLSLLILINDECENCISIKYSDMFYENINYSTINFNRNQLKPIIHTIQSPFKIVQSNKLIQLLNFKTVLPYFYYHPKLNSRCSSIRINKTNSINTILYVENKITFEKINLIWIVNNQQIYLSECLYHYWFIWPLMMDILKYLTSNLYDYHGLNRYIQIDIDDIFLGSKSNDRLKFGDIQALLRSQLFIQNYVSDFRYRLGFSGYYYHTGNDEENQGDRLLMRM